MSSKSKKIWRDLSDEFNLENHHLVLLEQALKSLDRAEMARAVVERDGMLLSTPTGYQKPHPALKVEHDATNRFINCWGKIGLDLEVPQAGPGRPAESKEIAWPQKSG